MGNTKIEAPWYEYRKKLNALFENDPDINVSEVDLDKLGVCHYYISVEVRNHEKYIALEKVLNKSKTFGNVTLRIDLYDVENRMQNNTDEGIATFATIFNGNPIIKDIKDVIDFTGTKIGFVSFKPEVIQFFNDDISDYNGNWSGLAEDIAKEVFNDRFAGIRFCTADLKEG